MRYQSFFYYLSCCITGLLFFSVINAFTIPVNTGLSNAECVTTASGTAIDTGNKPVVVKTNSVTEITATAAQCNFTMISSGNKITAFGVCVSKSTNPTISNQKFAVDKGGIGTSFHSIITGLTPVMKYYVRAYATSAAGTVYGNELSFVTLKLK